MQTTITRISRTRKGRFALFCDAGFLFSVDEETFFTEHLAEGLTLESTLHDGSTEEDLVERIALRGAIDSLPDQEKKTILLRFFKGLTQTQTARILRVSQVQVSRLERRALERLRAAFDQ